MNIKEIKVQRKRLISPSNPEWQKILNLRLEVQRDFNNNESLSISTYNKILDWKLDRHESRIEKIRTFSPDSLVKTIANCYCKVDHPDSEMSTKIKMHVLLSVPWIGIGISSAIMALHEPHIYGAIDLRSWSVLFQEDKKVFSMKDYLKYLKRIRELADKVGCDVQEIDYVLWRQYDTR